VESRLYSPQKVGALADFIEVKLFPFLEEGVMTEMAELAEAANKNDPKLREFTGLTTIQQALEADFIHYLERFRAVIAREFAGTDQGAELPSDKVREICMAFTGSAVYQTAQKIGMGRFIDTFMPRPADFEQGMADMIRDAIRPRYAQVFRFQRRKK
jgi:hypothetical protein